MHSTRSSGCIVEISFLEPSTQGWTQISWLLDKASLLQYFQLDMACGQDRKTFSQLELQIPLQGGLISTYQNCLGGYTCLLDVSGMDS